MRYGYSRYRDRREAGRALAELLRRYADRDDVVVYALPRGGVPVAYEIATALHAPLDVFPVRKLGVPGHEELAMGAVAPGGLYVMDEGIVNSLGVSASEFGEVIRKEVAEAERRDAAYRHHRPRPDVSGKIAIVVDDGLATGSTMRVAVESLRRMAPRQIIVAVPVGALDTCEMLQEEADKVICAATPEHFRAVGLYYEDFSQTTDEEVRDLLAHAFDAQAKRWSTR